MAKKALVISMVNGGIGDTSYAFYVPIIDTTSNQTIDVYNDGLYFGTDLITYTPDELSNVIQTKILAYSALQGYGLSASDITSAVPLPFSSADIALLKSNIVTPSYNYAPGRSIVTGTGATGFQVSSTRKSFVTYTPKIVTTATIAGGQEGYVVLEIASTNSATAGDWKEVARVTNGQALSLALTLQSIQPVSAPMSAYVPAGYYVKVRSVNITGTPSFSMVSGQEVLL